MATDVLASYLGGLFGRARASTLVEVRWRTAGGMRRRFVRADALERVASTIRSLGVGTDVYVGVLPRWRPAGARADVVGDGRTVWVDRAPSLVVASGAEGHVHAYWRLRRAVAPSVIERANGRLAFALGGDLRAGDAARILRPPGTVNHKHDAPVRLAYCEPSAVGLGELVGGLPDAPSWRPQPRARRAWSRPRRLDVLAPEVYVRRLTGQEVGRSRKVRCPLHDDETPSLHVYAEADQGWFCFGCGRGGTVYDLAAALWGRELRGRGFAALRADLHALLID